MESPPRSVSYPVAQLARVARLWWDAAAEQVRVERLHARAERAQGKRDGRQRDATCRVKEREKEKEREREGAAKTVQREVTERRGRRGIGGKGRGEDGWEMARQQQKGLGEAAARTREGLCAANFGSSLA
eukprot:4709038-Pleurochrysis_carterae.AAC.1